MSNIEEIIKEINEIKKKNNPNLLTQFFLSKKNEILPEIILLDKARAIQLSDGNEYELKEAETVLLNILNIDPDYTPAYLELGYFYDAIMDEGEKAISFFDVGIEKSQQILKELYFGKAKSLIYLKHYKEAFEITKLFEKEDERFINLQDEILNLAEDSGISLM